jgi:hypothetical protein
VLSVKRTMLLNEYTNVIGLLKDNFFSNTCQVFKTWQVFIQQ